MKRIQLMEFAPDGRILKNENYTYGKLKSAIRITSGNYFYHKIWGRLRCAVLDRVFVVFEKLTELDKPGKGSPEIM